MTSRGEYILETEGSNSARILSTNLLFHFISEPDIKPQANFIGGEITNKCNIVGSSRQVLKRDG